MMDGTTLYRQPIVIVLSCPFVKLQIYTLHWWRIEYTSVGLLVYFSIAKALYPRILRPVKRWLHPLFLYLCTAPLLGTLHIIPLMLFLNRYYHPGWFSDRAHDTTAFSSIYYLSGTFAVVTAVKLRWKHFVPIAKKARDLRGLHS
ncbi:hypothetical protein ACFPYJ_06715 [Paenibacillus solisilvae]|uniref:Uncharacterized protein n=1 Tax=Paenibacillus solisilvae TaxID=2486751 RepID=A0ABW0VSF5_9BACL